MSQKILTLTELLCLNDADFLTYIQDNEAIVLNVVLHLFWKKNKKHPNRKDVIERFLRLSPHIFIKTLRFNKVPLCYADAWSDVLKSSHNFFIPDECRNWLDLLQLIAQREQTIWAEAEEALQAVCEQFSIAQFLVISNILFEEFRFNGLEGDNISTEDLFNNMKETNLHVNCLWLLHSYFFSNYACQNESYTQTNLDDEYSEVLFVWEKCESVKQLRKAWELVIVWIEYSQTVCSTLFFDENIGIAKKSKSEFVIFVKSQAVWELWRFNGAKYYWLNAYYGSVFGEIVHIKWRELNRFALDICFTGFHFNDKEVELPSRELVIVAATAINAVMADEQWLQNIFMDYRAASKRLQHFRQKGEKFPLIVMNAADWSEYIRIFLNHNGVPYKSEFSEYFGKVMVYNFKKPFDRFDIERGVMYVPFFKHGEMIYCHQQSISERHFCAHLMVERMALENDRYRKYLNTKETQAMEMNLGEKFRCVGFKYVAANASYKHDGMEGDIDIMVFDDNTLFIGEIKRTKLRLNMEDAHNERMQTNAKAIEQLRKHLKFLKKDTSNWFGNTLKLGESVDWDKVGVKLLILSTSLEDDGHTFKINEAHCALKFNYLVLLSILGEKRFSDMSGLIREIDFFWHQEYNYKKMIFSVGNEMQLEYDPLRGVQQNQLYNETLDLVQKDIKSAYNLCEQLLALDNHSVHANQLMGNILFDMQRYEQAITFYSKVLERIFDHAEALYKRAVCYKNINNAKLSKNDFDKLRDYYRNVPHIFF